MDSSGGRRPGYGSIAEGGTVSTGGLGSEPTEAHDTAVLLEGQLVGEYRILGPLGAGGMGRVYAAEHPVIAKKAAIKVLHPELSVNREAVDRFVQEARSVNQIGHPNIVDIFSFGKLPDGRNYFVMEWLRGESLRDRIKRAPLPLVDAIAILETITLPLEAAHGNGIVHRDLKPDNVFLVDVRDDRPQVKLLDFGIAKLMGVQGLQRTQTGNMLGTPAYISPEQARAEGVDHRTDIYALGALAFELFTGEYVFMATNAADMIAKHLFEAPRSARTLNPHLPPELDALLARMLAKEAHKRPTLAEVRNQLRAIRMRLGGMPTLPPGMQPPHTPPHGVHVTPMQMTPMQMTPSSLPAAHPASTLRAAPPRRSRWLLMIGILLVALGAAAVALVVVGQREHAKGPAVEAPAAETYEMKVSEPKPAAAEAKPTEPAAAEAKPTEPAAITVPPASGETKASDPKAAETKRIKRDGKKHSTTKPATTTNPTTTTTKPGTGSATKPFDPDAPM